MNSRWLVSAVMAILMLSAGISNAAEQTVQDGTAIGAIRVAVQDYGTMVVRRFSGTAWVNQTYGPQSKYSLLFLGGDNSSMIFGPGLAGTPWIAVSNTTSANNDAITSVFETPDGGVRITQVTSVKAGLHGCRMQWSIENIGSATYNDVRFAHGEDTYLAGNDMGEGHFDNALKMVYVTNAEAGVANLMGIYASASTPFSHYFEGPYPANRSAMRTWTMDNTVDPSNVDSGYSLGWTRATLAPGQTWTIIAYEKFTQSAGIQVIAPAEQPGSPGGPLTYAFTVRNLEGSPKDLFLNASSSHEWTTTVVDDSGNPLHAVSIAGGSETRVNVRVTPPTDAASGTNDLLTLSALSAEGNTGSDTTATVLPGAPVASSSSSPLPDPGMGSGIGSCGMVVGLEGTGAEGAVAGSGLIALYLAILLAPVGLLKGIHAKSRASM